jgi:aryl-alcohol dehydrogenase-like predicted oxidoreductase
MRHTQITGVILGASRMDHLAQNISALDDGPLPPEVLALCDQVWADLRGVTPQYNR